MTDNHQDSASQPKREYPGMGSYPGMGNYPGMGSYPGMGTPEEGLSLQEIFQSLWRRRGTIVVTMALVAVAALGFTLTQVPTYKAEARILLEESSPSSGILGELSMLSSAPPAAAELEVIQSRKLALQVVTPKSDEKEVGLGLTLRVNDLDRYGTLPLFMRHFSARNPKGSLHAKRVGSGHGEASGSYLVHFLTNDRIEISENSLFPDSLTQFQIHSDSPILHEGHSFHLKPEGDLKGRRFLLQFTSQRSAAEALLDRLSVSETARGSGVLRIAYEDNDPERAAAVVNELVDAYMASKIQRLTLQAIATFDYIESELTRTEGQLNKAEEKLLTFQEGSGEVMLPETARAAVERMSSLDLSRAQLSLVIGGHEHLVEALDQGELIENIASSAELGPQTVNLLTELAALNLQATFLEEEHTENWPPLMQVRAQVSLLRNQISKGIRARSSALQRQDNTLNTAIERWHSQLMALPAIELKLATLQREAQSSEQIYTYLLTEKHKAAMAQNSAIASVSIVDRAVPATSRSSPNISLSMAAALLLGGFLGAALALWREASQKTILTAAQLEAATGLAQWGIIPDFRKGGTKAKRASGHKHFLALRDAPDSAAAESYRALRANLRFAAKSKDIKTLTITSATQGEGKSTTIADLAIALAHGGAKVLLIDADLRRPVVHTMFEQPLGPGLAEILLGSQEWQDAIRPAGEIVGLNVITAGTVNGGTNPGDLLALERVNSLVAELREAYDFVLFDVPPVLAVADAASFLNQLDAILLLCLYDHVPENALAGAAKRLALSGAEPIGAVLNRVLAPRRSNKHHDYAYYSYDSTS